MGLTVLAGTARTTAQWVRMDIDSVFVTSFAGSDSNLFVSCAYGFGPANGIYRSTNGGTTWTQSGLYGRSLQRVVIAPSGSGGSNVFAASYALPNCTPPGGVFVSTDNGSTWTGAGTGQTYKDAYALAADSSEPDSIKIFVATADCWGDGHGVFLSTNNGTTWTNVTNQIADTCVSPECWVGALAVFGHTLFAGTVGRGVFLSTDNGATWTASTGLSSFLAIKAFASHGTDLFVGAAGNGGGVFRSTDGGISWTNISAGQTDSHVWALVATGGNLFAGTAGNGVFLSTDNGANWTQVNDGLTDYGIAALAAVGPYLYAGSDRSGVWRRPLSQMITEVEDAQTERPSHFSLHQNYPNPFNPTTVITFTLPSRSLVSLKVFDVLGREVAILLAGELPAGPYSASWDPNGAASGVYFYRLQAGTFTETKKLVLLR